MEVALVALCPRWQNDSTWTAAAAELSVMINGKSTHLRAGGQHLANGLLISGFPSINLIQFDLTAPSRLIGLVKVNDEVEAVIILHFSNNG